MVAYPGKPQSILLELDLKLQNDFLKSRTGTKTSGKGKEEHDIGIRFFTSVRLELEMQREEDFFFGHL